MRECNMRMTIKGKKKGSGFSLLEVLVVVAILSIMATVAIPAFSSWVPRNRLKSATRDIYMAMVNARSRAVRENTRTVVLFDLANDTCSAFYDNAPANWAKDAAEPFINTATVQDGIDIYGSTFPFHTYGFNGRGLPDVPAPAQYDVYLKNQNGQYMGVRVSAIGSVSTITSSDGGATWQVD
jgi:prepilin-type N-terminal cleavage/methylation domain-containing protein